MFALPDYAKVKDNYCICYFGHSDEYLVQLRILRDVIQRRYQGLNLYFGCKDDKMHLLGEQSDVMKSTEIKVKKRNFAQIKYLEFSGETHPVEDLLVESGITNFATQVEPKSEHSQKMVITTHGNYPTTPLTTTQINKLKTRGRKLGYSVEINTDWHDAGWVVGVENVPLFEAAAAGIKTTLVVTGVGDRLYRMMFPNGETLSL